MQFLVNKKMVSAGLAVLEESQAWPDYPYTNEQLVDAILRNAMAHYVPPSEPKPEPGLRPSQSDEGFVYFITDGEAIKIGKANNVTSRLSGLRTSSARPMECLGFQKGGRRKERELHRLFDDLRIKGEWFQDCPEIREYIAAKCKPFAANSNRPGRPKKFA